eukprot:852104-Rhodomonas_salina.2
MSLLSGDSDADLCVWGAAGAWTRTATKVARAAGAMARAERRARGGGRPGTSVAAEEAGMELRAKAGVGWLGKAGAAMGNVGSR